VKVKVKQTNHFHFWSEGEGEILFLLFWESCLLLPTTHYPLTTNHYPLHLHANYVLQILHYKFCTTQYPQVADMQAGSGKKRANKSLSLSKWRWRWNVISINLRKLLTTTHYPLSTTHYPLHFALACQLRTANSALQILHYPIPTSRRQAGWLREKESKQITFTFEVKVKVKCYFY
jgi:hypothetical protein